MVLILFRSTREARVDDVIPLHEPIIGADGKVMNQVEVVAGQPVLVSTCAYNRFVLPFLSNMQVLTYELVILPFGARILTHGTLVVT